MLRTLLEDMGWGKEEMRISDKLNRERRIRREKVIENKIKKKEERMRVREKLTKKSRG